MGWHLEVEPVRGDWVMSGIRRNETGALIKGATERSLDLSVMRGHSEKTTNQEA